MTFSRGWFIMIPKTVKGWYHFMKAYEITLNSERNVTLTAYIQGAGGEFQGMTKRPAIIVLPGGGYSYPGRRLRLLLLKRG